MYMISHLFQSATFSATFSATLFPANEKNSLNVLPSCSKVCKIITTNYREIKMR